MRNLQVFFLALIWLAVSGCSTTELDRAKDRMKPITRLAVVSFEILQDQPPGTNKLNGARAFGILSSFSSREEIQAMARHSYAKLVQELRRKLNKDVLSLKEVLKNPFFQSLYVEKIGQFDQRTVIRNGVEIVSVKGMFDEILFRNLSTYERQQLAAHLGVDGFIEFMAFQKIERGVNLKSKPNGFGFRYKTHSKIKVYDVQTLNPVLILESDKGPLSRLSSSVDGVSPREGLSKVSSESVVDSIERILSDSI